MQLKKETNQRSTDLETTISQYYQQILTNSNSINDLNNKLQELGQLQQEQKDMNENKWLIQADNLKVQINALKEETESLIEKHNQIYVLQSATLKDDLEKKIKLNKNNIEHIDDTIEGIQKALIDHGDNHSQNVYKIHELNAFTNNLKENFNQNVEKFDQQNKSNIYALQELCKDLEVKQNVSSKTIQDLDQGSQSLLNKLIDLENQVGQNVTALKSKDSELDDRILSMTQDLLSVKNETNKHLEKVLMEQVSEINEIKETSILQKDQLSNQSTRITLCEKQIKHCDDTIDHLKGNIESSEKKIFKCLILLFSGSAENSFANFL